MIPKLIPFYLSKLLPTPQTTHTHKCFSESWVSGSELRVIWPPSQGNWGVSGDIHCQGQWVLSTDIYWVEVKDTGKHRIGSKTSSTTQNDLAQNGDSAKAENPCPDGNTYVTYAPNILVTLMLY